MSNFHKEALLSHTLGVRSAVDLAIPTGVDAGEIFKLQMRSSRTAEEVVRDAATAVGAANQQIVSRYGGLFTITKEIYGFTRNSDGNSLMTPQQVEFSDPDPRKGLTIGSMLPLHFYRDALGWTAEYLMDAVDSQLNSDVQELAERWLNRFDYQLFTRMFTNTENLIGTAGYDVPWAIGTGTNVDFIPPPYLGKAFSSSHSHFVVKDSDTLGFDDLFIAMLKNLREHGQEGRAVAWVNEDDLDNTIVALDDWVPLIPAGIQIVAGNSGAPIAIAEGKYEGLPGQLAGYFRATRGAIEVRYHPRVKAGYVWMSIPAATNGGNAPFAIRVHPTSQFGMVADPQLTNSINPKLKQVNFDANFGIGVNNRLAGVAGYLASGATTWVNPTIDGTEA